MGRQINVGPSSPPQADACIPVRASNGKSPIEVPGFISAKKGGDTKYVYEAFIGKGSYGTVWTVFKEGNDKKLLAVKVREGANGVNDRMLQEAVKEISCLENAEHFACISLVETRLVGTNLFIVTEYCDAGSLHYQLRQSHKQIRSKVGILALQLIAALQFLHSRNLLHRDIKPENVFVNTNGQLKIGDFGLSNVYETLTQDAGGQTICGTAEYFAPELCQRKQYGSAADMWSLGVLLYECMTNKRPFTADTTEGLYRAIVHDRVKPIEDYFALRGRQGSHKGLFPEQEYDETIANIIYSLLEKDPKRRPTSTQLLNNPYMMELSDKFLKMFRDDKDRIRIQKDLKAQMDSAKRLVHQMNSSSVSSVRISTPSFTTGVSSELMDFTEGSQNRRDKQPNPYYEGTVTQVCSTGLGFPKDAPFESVSGDIIESPERGARKASSPESMLVSTNASGMNDINSFSFNSQKVYLRLKTTHLIIAKGPVNQSSSFAAATLGSPGKCCPRDSSQGNYASSIEGGSFSGSCSCSSSYSSFDCDDEQQPVPVGGGITNQEQFQSHIEAPDNEAWAKQKDNKKELESEENESIREPSRASLAVRRGTQTPSATIICDSQPPVLLNGTKEGEPMFIPATPPRSSKSTHSFRRDQVISSCATKKEEQLIEFNEQWKSPSECNEYADKQKSNDVNGETFVGRRANLDSFLCAVEQENGNPKSPSASPLELSPREVQRGSLPALSPRWTTSGSKTIGIPVCGSKTCSATARTMPRGHVSSPNQKSYKCSQGSPIRSPLAGRNLSGWTCSPLGAKNDSNGGTLFQPFPSLQSGMSNSSFASGASNLPYYGSSPHRTTHSYACAGAPPPQGSHTLLKHRESILSPLKPSLGTMSQIISSQNWRNSSHPSSARSVGEKIFYIPPSGNDGNSNVSSPFGSGRGALDDDSSRTGLEEVCSTSPRRVSVTPNLLRGGLQMRVEESRNSSHSPSNHHLGPREYTDDQLYGRPHRYDLSVEKCIRHKSAISAKNSSANFSSCNSSPADSPDNLPAPTPDPAEVEGSPVTAMPEDGAEIPRTSTSLSLPVLVYPTRSDPKPNTVEQSKSREEALDEPSLESQNTNSYHRPSSSKQAIGSSKLQDNERRIIGTTKGETQITENQEKRKPHKHHHHHCHKGKKRTNQEPFMLSDHSTAPKCVTPTEKNVQYQNFNKSYVSLSDVQLLSSSDCSFTLSVEGREMCFRAPDAKKWSEAIHEALTIHQSSSHYQGPPSSTNAILPQGSSTSSSFQNHGLYEPHAVLPNVSASCTNYRTQVNASNNNPSHYPYYVIPNNCIMIPNCVGAPPASFQTTCPPNAYPINQAPQFFFGSDIPGTHLGTLGPNEWNSTPQSAPQYPNPHLMCSNFVIRQSNPTQGNNFYQPADASVSVLYTAGTTSPTMINPMNSPSQGQMLQRGINPHHRYS